MRDFVVVGAGPAGSRFARSAAERGREVLVLEQGEIGQPLACSGHVSLDVWEYVPGSDEQRTSDSARDDLFQNAIRGARFHLGGADSRAYPFYRDEPVSNAVDRWVAVLVCFSVSRGLNSRGTGEVKRSNPEIPDGDNAEPVSTRPDEPSESCVACRCQGVISESGDDNRRDDCEPELCFLGEHYRW